LVFEKELKDLLKKSSKGKVSTKAYRMVTHGLQEVSVGYSSALYFAGKKIGKNLLSEQIKGKDLKSIVSNLNKFFKKEGLGSLKIKEMTEKTATIVLKGSASSSGMTPVGKPVCFFEGGLISGVLEAKTKKKVVVNEVLCGGLGDKVDEFLVKFE